MSKKSFSPERHQSKTMSRLVMGGFLVLLGVGGVLIWAFYGGSAAVTAIVCILGFGGILGLLWLILTLMELWVKDDEF
jgi:hypothetical protein